MKAVLLVLSGDPARAHENLSALIPEAAIASLLRSEVEQTSYLKRLEILRRMRPDVFVVATERLAWQRGQNALLLFGALAGARRVMLVDSSGDIRE